MSNENRLCKLLWAELQLKVIRDNITREIAPQTAKKVRSTLKSLQGAIRHAERMNSQNAEVSK